MLVSVACGFAQELTLSPTRPTVANGATIQSKGVLQVEAGYDAYPQSVPGNQQTVDTLVTYAPLDRLRLDMLWSAFNHQQEDEDVTYGKDGDLDVIANGSLVQSDCQTRAGCSYGGQQSFAVSYHVNKQTRLYAEVFGQNVSQSNTPPGTYVFGGFYRQLGEAFGIDGGMRFGVSDHSASVGSTIGLVFGRRLRGDGGAK
ncbi:hypothetical protein JAO29_11270 [Edaphobacter sp. HDX4]